MQAPYQTLPERYLRFREAFAGKGGKGLHNQGGYAAGMPCWERLSANINRQGHQAAPGRCNPGMGAYVIFVSFVVCALFEVEGLNPGW